MTEILAKLLELAQEGRLELDGVVIGNSGYEIELGNDAEHFEGEIKLRVKMDTDVLTFGSILSEAMKK
tara:strand:- start:1351 stop:1554 length:204 start_codon:yes stop_codon:yes gene_type:complete